MTTIDDVRERLREIRPPGQPRDIVSAGLVHRIDVRDGAVHIEFEAAGLSPQSRLVTVEDIRRAVGALPGITAVHVPLAASTAPAAGPSGPPRTSPFAEQQSLPGIRDIIAVASTKGGVGKSTIAANLAVALRGLGHRIGLLDADVYGPSAPILFGVSARPRVRDQQRILPIEHHGVRIMSMGFFLDESSPVIWRGPLVMGLVRQFLKDVEWGDLDLLIVDLPPGTGDAQLTLVQQVPLTGGIIVTTPQDVATLDVRRGIAMLQQVNTPVLGVVENMSFYQCPKCGRHEDIFGSGGAAQIAARFGVPLLGQIPLVGALRTSGDRGTPLVSAEPGHPVSELFHQLAHAVLHAIASERSQMATPTIIE